MSSFRGRRGGVGGIQEASARPSAAYEMVQPGQKHPFLDANSVVFWRFVIAGAALTYLIGCHFGFSSIRVP